MKVRKTELENKLQSSEDGTRKECMEVIDARMKEVRKDNETVQTSFREIIKQQEDARRQVERTEVVKMLKQN